MKNKVLVILLLVFVIIISSLKSKESFDDEPINNDEEMTGDDCDIIKCNADFGTNIGDKLCCGQTERLTKDSFEQNLVCPMSRPKCSQFDCNTKRGICIKPSSDGYKINRIKSK
jgi:hypothetical protein